MFLILATHVLVATSAFAQPQKPDAKGCTDPALFPNRMPNYRIEKCETQPFGFYEFNTVKPPKHRVEGESTLVLYTVDRPQDNRSGLEVVRNYENAIRKIGGRIEAMDPKQNWWVVGTVTIDGKQTWVQAERGNGKIWLRMVKMQPMEQTIVADAAAYSKDLKSAGHVAVGGIYFDTASAVLKPESAPALKEIAKLLKSDPSLKVYVVGHTDSVGNVDANLKLSHGRAEAVIAALVGEHGVGQARLRPFGNGPFAPVASNASEEGRAVNRRVELVLQ